MSVKVLQSTWFSPIENLNITRGLFSVYDKTGIAELAMELQGDGVDLISTGGTKKILLESSLNVTDISDYTGNSELLGGRVKTLHPKVYAGLLAKRKNPEHMQECKSENIEMIDLVLVNLYPFDQGPQMIQF